MLPSSLGSTTDAIPGTVVFVSEGLVGMMVGGEVGGDVVGGIVVGIEGIEGAGSEAVISKQLRTGS